MIAFQDEGMTSEGGFHPCVFALAVTTSLIQFAVGAAAFFSMRSKGVSHG